MINADILARLLRLPLKGPPITGAGAGQLRRDRFGNDDRGLAGALAGGIGGRSRMPETVSMTAQEGLANVGGFQGVARGLAGILSAGLGGFFGGPPGALLGKYGGNLLFDQLMGSGERSPEDIRRSTSGFGTDTTRTTNTTSGSGGRSRNLSGRNFGGGL